MRFPLSVFAEDQSVGFYAGPLSVAAESVAETTVEDESRPIKKILQKAGKVLLPKLPKSVVEESDPNFELQKPQEKREVKKEWATDFDEENPLSALS